MVDVGDKPETDRSATAEGRLLVSEEVVRALEGGNAPKGDPLTIARIAGIQAAKRTAELIPLCHSLPLTNVDVAMELDPVRRFIRAVATARVVGRTGVEMEALTAVTVALLTAYDMLKAIDRTMQIEGVRLIRKSGGRSGEYQAEGEAE